MKDIDENGIFWLPDSPGNTFGGHLKFSAQDGASLVVIEDSVVARRPSESIPRILGVVRDKKVTLLDCMWFTGTRYRPGLAYNSYRPQHLLIGQSFISEDDPSFTTAVAKYHNLPQWVNRTGFISDPRESPDELTIRYIRPERLSGQFSRGTVYVDFNWRPDGEDLRERRIIEWPSVRVAYSDPTPLDKLLRDLRHIQDLVTLCTDTPSQAKSIILQRPNLPETSLEGRPFPNSQDPIEYLSEPLESPSGLKTVRKNRILVGLDDIGGIDTICKWLDNANDLGYVLGLLMTGRTTRSLYVENRFLNICAAAEAFHRLIYGGTQISPERFEMLRRLALESMPNGRDRAWLKGKLRYNEPTLADRLHSLASKVEPAIDGLVTNIRSWSITIAEVRNRLVHQDRPGMHKFDGELLHWLAESVFSLARASMLRHAGVGDAVMRRIGESQTTTWYRTKLDDALARARQLLDQRSSAS